MASDWRPVVYPAFLRSLLRHVRRLERDAVAHLDELERQALASEVPAAVLINGTLIRGLLRYVHRLERDAVARAHVQDFGIGELG